MYKLAINFRRTLQSFIRRESGVVSVEGVLWVPIYLIFLSVIVDVSLMMHHKSNALRAMQDATRGANVGLYVVNGIDGKPSQALTLERATTELKTALNEISTKATVKMEAVGPKSEYYLTSVSLPSKDLIAVGFFTAIFDFDINLATVHLAANYWNPAAGSGTGA